MLEEKECGWLEQGGKREERLIWNLGSEKGLDRWDPQRLEDSRVESMEEN